jgi:hypothetical protein
MLGFAGHFLTKSRRHRVTFQLLRRHTGPQPDDNRPPEQEATLVVNFLQFVGAGWKTPADAMLANTSAALARDHEPNSGGPVGGSRRLSKNTVKPGLTPNARGARVP